jgi:hypothetical protein
MGDSEAPKGWSQVYDFIVQDVCIGANGEALIGTSPADGLQRCPRHRNLRIGELLPYHKQDWQATQRANKSRNDEFPIETALFGTAVVQARNVSTPDGQQVNEGGGIFVFSPDTVASILTEGHEGIRLYYGPQCASASWREKLANAWVFVGKDFAIGSSGTFLARLTRDPADCPDRLSQSYTTWSTTQISLRVGNDGIPHQANFVALISNHFGGESVEAANHLERFYFTRELGLIRWERWENLSRPERNRNSDSSERAEKLQHSNRCDPIQTVPSGSGEWIMIDCRQWTDIVKPVHAGGDAPSDWIEKLRSDPQTKQILAQ